MEESEAEESDVEESEAEESPDALEFSPESIDDEDEGVDEDESDDSPDFEESGLNEEESLGIVAEDDSVFPDEFGKSSPCPNRSQAVNATILNERTIAITHDSSFFIKSSPKKFAYFKFVG